MPTVRRYQDELFALEHFVDLCLAGLQHATQATSSVEVARRVAKVFGRPDPFATEAEREEVLKRAKKLESFAKEQQTQGFPYLYGLAAIKTWVLLEGLVDDIVSARIRQLSLTAMPALTRIRGLLVEFMNATEDERIEILLERLKEATDASLKRGCGRFEVLLDAVGLGGPVDDSARKALLELSEVRNTLVHRNGVADRRFREACPWFGAELGMPIRLTPNHFQMYSLSAWWYLLEMHRRLTCDGGDAISEEQAILQEEFAQKITIFLKSRADRQGDE